MKNPHRWILLIAVLLGAGLLSACGGGAEQASNELNVYAWSEYLPQALVDAFSEETGIHVNYDTYSSNEELLAKLQAGGSGYDIIIPSDYTVQILISQGMLEPIDKGKIPNFSNLDPAFTNLIFDPDSQYSVPYQWGTLGIAVNTEQVSQPVTKWADLWDPAFEGRLLVPDDSRETLGMVLMSLGYDRNSTDPAELEAARLRMIELLPNIRLFDSDSPKTALLAGEVALAVTWNGEAVVAHQENPAIQYVFPEDGVGVFFDTLAIPKGAPHVDAAHTFINFVLSPEASLMITEEFPYSNPNLAALELLQTQDPAAYEAYMSFAGTNPPDDVLARAQMIKDVGEATTLWDRIWTEIKEGR